MPAESSPTASPASRRLALLLPMPGFAVCALALALVARAEPALGSTVALVLAGVVALAAVLSIMLTRRLVLRPLQRLLAACSLPADQQDADFSNLLGHLEQSLQRASERERLLESVLSSMPGCVYRLEPTERRPSEKTLDLKFKLLSEGFEHCTGFARADVPDMASLVRWILPVDQEVAGAEFLRHLRAREPWEIEYRIRSPDGQVRWLVDRGVPVCNERGELLHVHGVLMDTTARARDLEQARLLGTAVDRSLSEVLLFDPISMRITYANAGVQENLQFDPVGQVITDIVQLSPADLRRSIEQVDSGIERRFTWLHQRADGSRYPVETTLTFVESRGMRMLMSVGLDVEERDAREQSLLESEQRFRLVLEAARDGIWDVDLRTNRVYLSPEARRIVGTRPGADDDSNEEFNPERLLASVHHDDRERVQALASAYVERRSESFDTECRFRVAGGAYRWLHLRGLAVWDDVGTPTRFTLCLSDITQRRIAESILRDTVSRLGAVLEHVAEGIVTFDANGQVRSFNPAAERIFGWTQEQILDQPINCIVPVPRVNMDEPWDRAYARLQATESAMGVRRDGDVLPLEIAVTRLVAAGHELYTAVVRDVSERRHVEEQLRAARDSAESSLRAKSEFLAVMSHEIRTPLNGVLGMAQLLLESGLNSDQRETVQTIQRSGEALLTIINDVLDFSKIEAGRMQIEAASFDLRLVIREVFDLVAARVRERGIELVLDYAQDAPRRVNGDSARVRQVLVNLLGNAVKFTEQGHVAVCVSMQEETATGVRLAIAVEDSGIGIEPGVQKRLFTAFTQADASTTRRFGGTGLGLAISKHLTSLMGGELTLHSVPGAGSVFTLRIEFAKADEQNEDSSKQRPQLLMPRMVHVLVPYRRARDVLTKELTALGCGVRTAADVEALFAGAPTDLLLVDRVVLGKSVGAFAERLRARGQECIALVATFADGDREVLLREGFAGALSKPIGAEELAVAINALHERGSAAPELLRDRPAGNALRVLVADDNSVNQRVAMRMLQRLGCEVLLADDGRAALQAWREHAIDLVLMDVRMPVMDGIEATASIRAEETRHGHVRVPIVGISANSSIEDEQQCRAAGMDDFVPKPIKLQGLEKVIATLVLHDSPQLAASS